jgi:hypothetical protein
MNDTVTVRFTKPAFAAYHHGRQHYSTGDVATIEREFAERLIAEGAAERCAPPPPPPPVVPLKIASKIDLSLAGHEIVRQLPQPDDDPTVRAAQARLSALARQAAEYAAALTAAEGEKASAREALTAALAEGKPRRVEEAETALDTASTALTRSRRRLETVQAAITSLEGELDAAWSTAIAAALEAWAPVLAELEVRATSTKQANLEAAARLKIVEAAHLSVVGRQRGGRVSVRFVREYLSGRVLYNAGEVAGFRPSEANRIVTAGLGQYVETWREKAAEA